MNLPVDDDARWHPGIPRDASGTLLPPATPASWINHPAALLPIGTAVLVQWGTSDPVLAGYVYGRSMDPNLGPRLELDTGRNVDAPIVSIPWVKFPWRVTVLAHVSAPDARAALTRGRLGRRMARAASPAVDALYRLLGRR